MKRLAFLILTVSLNASAVDLICVGNTLYFTDHKPYYNSQGNPASCGDFRKEQRSHLSEPIRIVKPESSNGSATDYDRMQDSVIQKLERYIKGGL